MADGITWCGYADYAAFLAKDKAYTPSRTARVIYSSGEIREISYEAQPPSGDWRIIDIYTLSGKDALHLERINVLGDDRVTIIQVADIREGKAQPLRIKSVTPLGGASLDVNVSKIFFPRVLPVVVRLDAMPFLEIASDMHHKSIGKLCKKKRG